MGRNNGNYLTQYLKTELVCIKCNKSLPKTSQYFSPIPKLKYNNRDDIIFKNTCRKCHGKYTRKSTTSSSKNVLINLFHSAKTRSKLKKLDFDLDKDFLNKLYDNQNGLCALTGIPLTFTRTGEPRVNKNWNPTNISIDRINPLKGYVKDNIQLVCIWANMSKSTLSKEDFLNFCNITTKYNNCK